MNQGQHHQPGPVPPTRPSSRLRWRTVLRQRWIGIPALVVMSLSVFLALGIVLLFHTKSEPVVLHYTTLFGITRLGSWQWLLVAPGALSLLVVAHIVVFRYSLLPTDRFHTRLLAVTSFTVSATLVAALIFLVRYAG